MEGRKEVTLINIRQVPVKGILHDTDRFNRRLDYFERESGYCIDRNWEKGTKAEAGIGRIYN